MPKLLYGTVLPAIVLMLTAGVCAQLQPEGKNNKKDAKQFSGKDLNVPGSKGSAGSGKPSEAPAPAALDKMKLPKDAIIILVDKLQEAAELIPKAIYLSPEKYQELLERIRTLEKQLKPERNGVNSCKLTGKWEGDYLALQAEFMFATQQPKTSVILGLQGAHLSDGGTLDGAAPQIDYGEDGFMVHVDNAGTHHLTLHLKTPVGPKRGAGPITSGELGFDLGLPGAPATVLNLELPAAIKEVRVNDNPRKSRTPGRWDVPLGLAKQLSVMWKEPQARGGGGPLLTMDAQITVELKETTAQMTAELQLEDARGLTKEWRLLLPPGAKPSVTSLPAGSYEWVFPNGQAPCHVLKTKDAASGRVAVSVVAEAARPASKIAVGPFSLLGALSQQGNVLVQTTPEALSGQRLVYHRHGDVTQRNLPQKNSPGAEPLAFFHFTAAPPDAKMPMPPIELEFKSSGVLAETQTDHKVKVKGGGAVWMLETTTRMQTNSLGEVSDFLDVQLPSGRTSGLEALAAAPVLAFPGMLSWSGIVPQDAQASWAIPLGFRWEERDSSLSSGTTSRVARLQWSRQSGRQLTLTIHGKYAVPYGSHTAHVELPRPLSGIERGATLTVSCGPSVELLRGPAGAAESVADRHRWQRQFESAPTVIDLSWQAIKPQLNAKAVADVAVRDNLIEVKERLQFTAQKTDFADAKVRLHLPTAIRRVTVASGGTVIGAGQPENDTILIAPQLDSQGQCDVLLEYEIAAAQPAVGGPQRWEVPMIWPSATTYQEAKALVWSLPGSLIELHPDARAWHQRGIETVVGREFLPSLVASSVGTNEPLVLRVQNASGALSATICDRTLIQVQIDADGNQSYRVRHWIRKLAARQLTLELPTAIRDIAGDNLTSIRIGPDRQLKSLAWHGVANNKATTSELPSFSAAPIMLEVEYKVPTGIGDAGRFGQIVLHPPRWHSELLPGAVRWQVDMPDDRMGVLVDGGLTLDVRWLLKGWLIAPEASVTTSDLEAWLTGREGGEGTPVSLAFRRSEMTPLRLAYFPRQAWLLFCSCLVLALGLAWNLLPLARWFRWIAAVLFAVAVTFAALTWPAMAPPIVYGMEPGLAVLIGLLGLQWLLQEHYRRQVVVMPGFARLQPGSTLNRADKAAPKREPTTIDAPPTPLSSVNGAQK